MAQLRHPPPSPMCAVVAVKKSLLSQRRHVQLSLGGAMLTAAESQNSTSMLWSICLIDKIVKGKDKGRSICIVDVKAILVKLFFETDLDYATWLDTLARAATWKLGNFYDLDQELGQGQFARVRKGFEKLTREPVAVKIVRKRHQSVRTLDFVDREYEIMSILDHPNIIKTFDVFDEPDRLYIVLEYMPGGQLFDVIQQEQSFTEKNACQVMRDILRGLQYLHAKNVIHRDIKPENILVNQSEFPLEVKIADFGLANFIDSESSEVVTERIGTPMYIAPEMVQGKKHGLPVDMWACGVLLYTMLSGRFPFMADSPQLVMRKVAKGLFSFPESSWRYVSIDAKMLIRGLLNTNPEDRLTADAALQHRWMMRDDRLSNLNLQDHIPSFRNCLSLGKPPSPGKLAAWSVERSNSSSFHFRTIEEDDAALHNRPSGKSRNSSKSRSGYSVLTRAEADLEDLHKSRSSRSPPLWQLYSRGLLRESDDGSSMNSPPPGYQIPSSRSSHYDFDPPPRPGRRKLRLKSTRRADFFRSMGF